MPWWLQQNLSLPGLTCIRDMSHFLFIDAGATYHVASTPETLKGEIFASDPSSFALGALVQGQQITVRTHLHTYTCTHIFVHMYTITHTHTYTYKHTHITHTHICKYAQVHTCTYTHTHMQNTREARYTGVLVALKNEECYRHSYALASYWT